MSRLVSEKCRLCFKLSPAQAQQLHGVAGDGCWEAKRCHDRRSYYRHRGVKNYNRKQRRQQQIDPTQATHVFTLSIPVPATPAAVAH